jgi:integrase/recombinase XerD
MPRQGQRIKGRKPAAVKPVVHRKAQPDPLAHLPLTRYMEAHFEWMMVKGYSADTVRARRTAIRRFIVWCDERGIQQPTDIIKPVLERYQRHLFYYRKPDGTPLTLGSQFGALAPLKTWFKWLARENHTLFNPASELELPKLPKHLPRTILSVPEVEAILAEADPDTPYGLRDRAMLELMYSTGMRRMEVAALALYDLDPARRLVFVREGKGAKDRVVPVGLRALAWLDRYLTEARPLLVAVEHECLFVTDYGEPVAPVYVALRVKKYMEHAGIHKPGAAHLIRHAAATHMYEAGADLRVIQALLGHAQLTTTQIYTHVSIEHLRAVHEATHPARLQRLEGLAVPSTAVGGGEGLEALLEALADEEDGKL